MRARLENGYASIRHGCHIRQKEKPKEEVRPDDKPFSRGQDLRDAGKVFFSNLLIFPCAKCSSPRTKVWDNISQSYVTRDKYQGRDLDRDQFISDLRAYLHDGERLLARQIPVLLPKIYALARIINRLKGFRFYGCSLLLIYDGDYEAQEAFRKSVMEHTSASRNARGESLERGRTEPRHKHLKELRRSHSEDLFSGSLAKRSSGRHKRGEINVRVVDFAHTTTGRDWLPLPVNNDHVAVSEVTTSEGYLAEADPETGRIYARFPPHFPNTPDRGFLFGLRNLAVILERIYNEERFRRIEESADDQLPPLPPYDDMDIFDEIFGPDDEDLGEIST
jgi:inositol-hexakisphosphate kinase